MMATFEFDFLQIRDPQTGQCLQCLSTPILHDGQNAPDWSTWCTPGTAAPLVLICGAPGPVGRMGGVVCVTGLETGEDTGFTAPAIGCLFGANIPALLWSSAASENSSH